MRNRRSGYLIAGCTAAILGLVGAPEDPWTRAQVITPEQLAKQLSSREAQKPTLISVAFRVLYQNGHIPGSLYFGPGRDTKAMNALKEWARSVPKTQNIVIYCGCCPWDHCPNVRPAFEALEEMGFIHLRVVEIPNNLGRDWVDKGYPVEKGH